MKISIIIPVFNSEAFIERCIASVMQQTYNDIECILIDDATPDESIIKCENILSNYYGPIKFKILHNLQNVGVSASRNVGINAISGDYFFLMDADDMITPDCIEKLVEPLKTKKYDMVFGFFDRIDEEDNQISTYTMNLPIEKGLNGGEILDCYMKIRTKDSLWGVATVWNKLYLTDFILRNQLFFKEGILHEDDLWSFEVACLASSLYTINHTTYHYRKWGGSTMGTYNNKEKAYRNSLIVKEMGDFVRKHQIYSKAIHELIQSFFLASLRYCIWRPFEFFSLYKKMRPHVLPSKSELIQMNTGHIKGWLRDFHYFLPCFIAPFLEYCIYVPISFSKFIQNSMK